MAIGSIISRVYTSDSEIPLNNAAVSIMRRNPDNTMELLAFRLTNYDGLTDAFPIEAPDASLSQTSGAAVEPFAVVDMMAEQVGYDRILTENVQVFAGVETRQDFELIPTAELPDIYDRTEIFNITAQGL